MKAHKWFSDFVSEGVVDFAVVDCESIPSVRSHSLLFTGIDQAGAQQQGAQRRDLVEPSLRRGELRVQQSPQRRDSRWERLSPARLALHLLQRLLRHGQSPSSHAVLVEVRRDAGGPRRVLRPLAAASHRSLPPVRQRSRPSLLSLSRTAPSSSPSAPLPCCASSSSSRASASSSSPATSWGFHVSTTHRASAIWRAWRVRATRTSTCTALCRCRPTSTRWISSCSRRREQCSTRPIWRASLCAKRGRVTRRTRCTWWESTRRGCPRCAGWSITSSRRSFPSRSTSRRSVWRRRARRRLPSPPWSPCCGCPTSTPTSLWSSSRCWSSEEGMPGPRRPRGRTFCLIWARCEASTIQSNPRMMSALSSRASIWESRWARAEALRVGVRYGDRALRGFQRELRGSSCDLAQYGNVLWVQGRSGERKAVLSEGRSVRGEWGTVAGD